MRRWRSLFLVLSLLLSTLPPAPVRAASGVLETYEVLGENLIGRYRIGVTTGAVVAEVEWGEWKEDSPFTPDHTLYPFDTLTLRLSREGSVERYEIIVEVLGRSKRIDGGELPCSVSFELQDCQPGRKEVSIRVEPKKARLQVTWLVGEEKEETVKELDMILDGTVVHLSSKDQWQEISIEQGEHEVEWGEIENYETPPPIRFVANAGERYVLTVGYRKEDSYRNIWPVDESWTRLEGGSGKLEFRVVPYCPVFTTVGYLKFTEDTGDDPWCYKKPFVVLARYDGNAYDPENMERRALDERAVMDLFWPEGSITKYQVTWERKEQLRDNAQAWLEESATLHFYFRTPGETPVRVQVRYARSEGEVLRGMGSRESWDLPRYTYDIPYWTEDLSLQPGLYYFELGPAISRYTGEEYPAPPPFYVLIPPMRESVSTLRVTYRENLPALVENLEGCKLNPPFWDDPVYRRDERFNIRYYEPGDVEAWDNGQLKYENAACGWEWVELSGTSNISNGVWVHGWGEIRLGLELPFYLERIGGIMYPPLKARGKDASKPMVFVGRKYFRWEFSPEWKWDPADSLATVEVNLSLYYAGSSTPSEFNIIHGRVQREAFGNRMTFSPLVGWSAVGSLQPLEVRAWALKEFASWEGEMVRTEELIAPENHPEAVLSENLWETDPTVSLSIKLHPLFELRERCENYKNLGIFENLLLNLGILENLPNLISSTGRVAENLAGQELIPGVRIGREEVRWLKSIPSILRDPYFLEKYLQDVTFEKEPEFLLRVENGVLARAEEIRGPGNVTPLQVSGGKVTLKRYGGTDFIMELGEKVEWIDLPFNPRRDYKLNVNLSGGFSVKVTDLPWEAKLRVFTPPQAGRLAEVSILDNENRIFYCWERAPPPPPPPPPGPTPRAPPPP
ncbi:MAG: hypothetical protein QW356_09110, partial [Candidatus Hadarchaeales archaeon]